VHLAARKKVDESVARPLWYFEQNVGGVLAVLAAMNEAGVRRLLFSSTAAVYGDSSTRVAESSVTAPSNPYGESKLVGEWMIRDQSVLGMLRATSLRYFNVLGAASPEFGDLSESNIVPMVYERIERGEQPVIFGDGYPTLDGTCVRDYVHVVDVAMAHLVALDELADPAGTPYQVFNVGTGQGASVRELIERMILIAGSHIEPRVAPPRPGDPASVVADPSRIHDELGWQATFDLDQMLESAWAARLARQGN
jgi:UDP-glucose 4-epimerase